jgi:hypothetical protein
MSKYNKVYFLHIPKTGGRFLTKYILRPIENTLRDNGIELVKSPEDMRQHAGWPSWIDDQTYVITVLREPCEFFVSSVCHAEASKKGLIDEKNWHIIKNGTDSFTVSKDEVYSALNRWEYIKDFQSQNFALSPDPEQMSILHESMAKHNKNELFDKEEIYKRVKRVNLMIRHKDLNAMDYNLLINKISEDLGIEINIKIENADKEHFKNNSSEILFNSLSKADKDFIVKHFPLDKEIYENDSLFWNPSR